MAGDWWRYFRCPLIPHPLSHGTIFTIPGKPGALTWQPKNRSSKTAVYVKSFFFHLFREVWALTQIVRNINM